ncbi:C-5 cytosine-specific DNA methylase, partial [Aspergillus arachidicola]
GIDREVDTRAYGIVGCITPSGIPYLTIRGGPLCGLESLSLQGLPLDRLILARETQAELQQLAGNAMSSTVVGAAILSALIVGHKVLDEGSQQPRPKEEVPKHKRFELCHDHELVSGSINVDEATDVTISDIQGQAASSARYCVCERQTAIKRDILRCKLCDHTACSDCAGNPTHNYQRASELVRTQPLDFVSRLRSSLPTRLVISGILQEHYDVFKADISIDCSPSVWKKFLDAVALLMSDEFRFVDIKRSSVWTVIYEGKHGVISLVVSDFWSCWSLHAKPSEDEPVVCLIREILSKPIARMTPNPYSLLEGEWEILSPISSKCALIFSGSDHRIESFEAKCGLQVKGFPESKVWTQITVDGADDDIEALGVDVRGIYDLLSHCGTASGCLHKKPAVGNSPAIYFFLDPSKLDEPMYDSFVFSLEHERTLGYASRSTIAELSHKWRSSSLGSEPEYANVYYRKSIKLQAVTLAPYVPDFPIICSNLKPLTSMVISNQDCRSANITLLSFEAQATAIDSFWKKGPWEVANPVESPALLGDISWLLQKAVGFSAFQDWISVNDGKSSGKSNSPVCGVCVPAKPRIIWGRNTRGQIKAYEDPHDAALYERQVKLRPPPFLVFRRVDEEDNGHMRVTLNVQMLLHQAYERLLNTNVSNNASFFWRVVPNSYDSRNLVFPDFSLVSNRNNAQSAQPPNFQLDLRPEQLRSLSWMIHRESLDIEPFIEEEVEEALLPMLMWRAEGKVCVEKTVRGGVLADDVGYGKTAITLGLIDTQYNHDQAWQSEITKFLNDTYRVLVIDGLAALGRKTVRDIQQADIVLASWAVFNSQNHYDKLQQFTGMPRVPPKAGRNFDDWFVKAHAVMMELVQLLVDQGPRTVLESIQARRQEVKDNEANSIYIPSKRLKGDQYSDVHQGQDPGTEAGAQHVDSSTEDGLSESSEEEDPEEIRARVDKLLKLQPRTTVPTTSKKEKDGESDSEDSEDEEVPTASRSGKAHGSGKRGQGVKRKRAPGKTSKVWDDRKEFGINNTAQQAWTTVKLPLLHVFSFNRLVIDEFTFANPERLVPLLKLQARSKWVLSGTPPLNDFADVNTIAPFLGIHLGIDDDDIKSQNARLKMIHKQRSEAESFQALRAPRSEEWHRRRHDIAQRFLDEFTRKNVAEIDEIPSSEHIVLIQQSPAETVIYLELCKQLMTYNRLGRRGGRKGIRGDREDRLDEVIGGSKTSEEALLKRCSSLALQGRWHNGVPEALTCSSLIETRLKQLEGLKEELMEKFKQAAWVYCACDLRHEKFHEFIESIKAHDFGDKTVTEKIYPLVKSAMLTSQTDDWMLFFSDPAQVAEDSVDTEMRDGTEVKEDNDDAGGEASEKTPKRGTKGAKTTEQGVRKEKAPKLPVKPTHISEFKLMLRTVTSGLRKLILEWVARERALRFLKAVHLVQTGSEIAECSSCHTTPETANHINILGSCGHALCSQCTLRTAQKEECNVEGCRGSGKEFNVMDASTLKCDERDRSAKYGGSKLDKMIEIIQAVPTGDRILLFIQFPELIVVASKALELAKIKYTAIIATDRRAAQKVQHFQEAGGFGENKVLILNLGSEMAAGLNLQCANHVIFLSPMFAQTQYDYDSSMTQAIGRARRYGQTKHVYIYHLLARMTIDTTLFQDRHGKVLVERNGEATLAAKEEVEEWEMVKGEAMSLVVDNVF